MAKIKGWTKVSDTYKQVHWNNRINYNHRINVMLNKIGNAWVVDVSHYNNGRESSLRLFKSELVTRQEALRQATNYMRSHPNG